ncbi:hypothetical protein L6452_17496 [Arctium lappa]|uniref:Uncharacterized protein n=1 Tax=Arctium lappa TaxID=4217 RepID=A0ACB9C3E6_ARCLA|nr:hypothetical protein L6452_17496 [Arctium lappa]
MADDLELKDEPTTNPCCNEWKNRVLKLEKKIKKADNARAALKQAVEIYAGKFTMMEKTHLEFRKAYEELKLQADQERKDKEKESAARVSLENEISTLKSEILSSSKKGGSVPEHVDEEVILLRGRIFDSEKEINCLKEQLQKEISVAAADRMKYMEEKKRTDDAWQSSKVEKCRTDEELSNLKAQLLTMETEKENEISTLKSEILSSSKKGGSVPEHVDEEVILLRGRIFDSEKEINCLKEQLQKEISVAAADRMKYMEEKKRTDDAWQSSKVEKCRTDEELSNLKAQLLTMETEKENEISTLKSEILSSSKKGGSVPEHVDEEVILLRGRIFDSEKEINCLREQLQKEISVAAADRMKYMEEKKRTDDAWQSSKVEKCRTDEELSNLKAQLLTMETEKENEISTLKSEILSLSKKGGSVPGHVNEELILLRGRVFDSEKEINCLREQLQKEISVAAADRMKYVEEKKRADDAWQSSKAEKCRTDEELSNLKAQLLTMETEKKQLMKDLQKERARADSEKKRADEALKTVNLDVVTSLQGHVSEMGTEISRLKELLDKERRRADSETKKAEAEKKNANKVREMLKAEQSTADEQRRLVDVEMKKAEENAHQLERLKREADEARSKVVSESSKFKEVNKKLEAERKKLNKEKKNAEKQQKIAELSTKNALEEKHRADRLHQQLKEYEQKYAKLKKEMEEAVSSRNVVEVPVYAPGKRTLSRETSVGSQGEEKINGINTARTVKNHGQVKQKTNQARNYADLEMEKEAEQKKAAEMYKLQAMTEKSRADKLAQQLKDTKERTQNASKDIQDLVSSRNSDPSYVLIQKDMKAKSAEMELLKKTLKLEKARVKHANRVAELEKNCKKAVEKELHRLKVEFAQFSNRVGLCSCFPICNVGKACLEKNGNIDSKRKFMQTEAYPLHLQSGEELMKPTCAVTKSSEYYKPSLDCATPSVPISGTCTESTSGKI